MDDSTDLKAQEAKPIEEGKREKQARAQTLAAVKKQIEDGNAPWQKNWKPRENRIPEHLSIRKDSTR